MKNTAPTKYNGARFFFTSDLSDDELQTPGNFSARWFIFSRRNRENNDSVIHNLLSSREESSVTGIFTALLLLTTYFT